MKDKLEENWRVPDGSTVKEKSESPDRISLKGCLVGIPSRRSVVDQDTVPESLPRHAEGVWSDESHVTDNIHIPAVDQGRNDRRKDKGLSFRSSIKSFESEWQDNERPTHLVNSISWGIGEDNNTHVRTNKEVIKQLKAGWYLYKVVVNSGEVTYEVFMSKQFLLPVLD
ncbi:hypothetical protein RRG08_045390 [Elysia crispata]|uniref:Uncharacterized protein n=1 Tax=Elysia crispata TaxID=231223 RepID=A0AAE0YAX5_9GAST|nr:hypothetical protein RRG08_045390 [Elysia crispata]